MLLRPHLLALLLCAGVALVGCASSDALPESPRPPISDNVAARIEVLEAAIAEDEEAIKLMIIDPERVPKLREDPELLAIAERLPKMQAELERLRPGGAIQNLAPSPLPDAIESPEKTDGP